MLLFSYLVVSDFLRPHRLQHTRLLCPFPSPEVCPNLCPLHWWCHPAISSSEALFSFCFSVFPSIRDFSSETAVCIRWPKYWSFSFSPSSEYSGLISLKIDLVWSPCYPRDFQESSAAPQFEGISSLIFCLLYGPDLTTGKTIALTIRTFVNRVMSLLFNAL